MWITDRVRGRANCLLIELTLIAHFEVWITYIWLTTYKFCTDISAPPCDLRTRVDFVRVTSRPTWFTCKLRTGCEGTQAVFDLKSRFDLRILCRIVGQLCVLIACNNICAALQFYLCITEARVGSLLVCEAGTCVVRSPVWREPVW